MNLCRLAASGLKRIFSRAILSQQRTFCSETCSRRTVGSNMPSKDNLPPVESVIRTEASTYPVIAGKVDHSQTEERFRTQHLTLQTLTYRGGQDGENSYSRRWDVATRATRDKNSSTDAIVVLARLRLADDEPRILLVKQFRPPLDGVTVELPAGLVDPGESVESAALRELREETGFLGTLRAVHPPAPLSPGLSNETVVLVEVDITGASQPQDLRSSENIHVISVPIARIPEALHYLSETEGLHIMHGVSTIGVGLSLATLPSSP